MFRRRTPLNFWQKLQHLTWPRTGWGRASRYMIQRVLRLSAGPHAIAMGFAVGVFVSALPFIGVHIAMAVGLAWLMRANVIASVIGTISGNPVTFPFIWVATFKVGQLILDRDVDVLPLQSLSFMNVLRVSVETTMSFIVPMTVGGIIIGLIMGLPTYYLSLWVVRFYQHRRARLARKDSSDNGDQSRS